MVLPNFVNNIVITESQLVIIITALSSSLAEGQKVYGCAVHPEPMDKYEEMMQKFLFAPDDVGEWSFTPKGDLHGIGYSGIDTTAEGEKEDSTMALYGMSGQVRVVTL